VIAVANRVFPGQDADDWRAGWVLAQDAVLAQVAESFAELPVWTSVYRAAEPVGVDALRDLAEEVYAGSDPLVLAAGPRPLEIAQSGSGTLLRLALPLVSRADVDLARNGDELVVTVGPYRRLLTLPAGLARHRVATAQVENGELRVRFEENAS